MACVFRQHPEHVYNMGRIVRVKFLLKWHADHQSSGIDLSRLAGTQAPTHFPDIFVARRDGDDPPSLVLETKVLPT